MSGKALKLFAVPVVAAIAAAVPVAAHCPLCAAATAGGVAATRLLGVDDTVVGTFIGGFVVSTGLWLDAWLRRKRNGKELVPFQPAIFILLSLALTIATFYPARLLGSQDPAYLMFGIDRLLIGTIAGTFVTVAAFAIHKHVKAALGRSVVPFQGIVLTLLLLSAAAAAFNFAT